MASVELVPRRLAPASTLSRASCQLCMPPAALTYMVSGMEAFISRTSATVAPPVPKPVLVLT